MSEITERWLPVVGYEGYYEVSDQGRVRRLPGRVSRGKSSIPVRGGVLKPMRRDGIYQDVSLWKAGVQANFRIHDLIAAAFIGPKPAGQVVRHRDCDEMNNRLSNLAYGTQAQNIADTLAAGRNFNASRTHCGNGHEYTEENTYLRIRGGTGSRVCRTCKTERWLAIKKDPARRAVKAAKDRADYLARKARDGSQSSL